MSGRLTIRNTEPAGLAEPTTSACSAGSALIALFRTNTDDAGFVPVVSCTAEEAP
jgi:hypothetical protein